MGIIAVRWSLSEFLNLLDTRSQCWGVVELNAHEGFHVRSSETVLFYAVLQGHVTVAGMPGGAIKLEAGDTLIALAGSAHALRTHPEAQTRSIDFLEKDEYHDLPHLIGTQGTPAARLLCGRVKVRWPGGLSPRGFPPFLHINSADSVVNLDTLVRKATGGGAAALLTRAAAALIIEGLRDHPDCQAVFRDANFRDPILRAVQIMELHPHQDWTIRGLAAKVGMARSTFAARFLAKVRRTPMEVLTEIRMRRAADLLTQSNLPVAEIAERCGYHSPSAFTRRFEQHFEMTPGQMRSQGSPAAILETESRG